MTPPLYSRPPEEIRNIFDRIAPRYDFLNSFLSFNQDKRWRRNAVRQSITGTEKSILDIGTGSGAFLEEFLHQHTFKRAVGVDVSTEMIALARRRLGSKAELLVAQVPNLPFEKGEFDLVCAAFVLRSVTDILVFFKEVERVLKPNGKFVMLELTRPANPILRMFYLPYLKFYLPLVGKFVSGSWNAYRFLSQSIQKFYEVGEWIDFVKWAGFPKIKIHFLTGGICTLMIAQKESS